MNMEYSFGHVTEPWGHLKILREDQGEKFTRQLIKRVSDKWCSNSVHHPHCATFSLIEIAKRRGISITIQLDGDRPVLVIREPRNPFARMGTIYAAVLGRVIDNYGSLYVSALSAVTDETRPLWQAAGAEKMKLAA